MCLSGGAGSQTNEDAIARVGDFITKHVGGKRGVEHVGGIVGDFTTKHVGGKRGVEQVGGIVGDFITKHVGGKRGVEQVVVVVVGGSQARSHLESVS